jgi:hypothetical protein
MRARTPGSRWSWSSFRSSCWPRTNAAPCHGGAPRYDGAVPDFDVNTPHIARICDYWLGGKDNFEADRKAAELALAATPTIVPGVRANRRFLAITHPASDQLAVATEAEVSLTRSIGQKMTFRRYDEVAGFFAGLDLVEPGVVPVQDWRATSELDFNSAPTAMWGGVGRKE